MSADPVAHEDADEAQVGRDIVTCPATWSPHERGYIRVVHPTTGEEAEIPYERATDVWKTDIRRLTRRRRAGRD